MSYDLDIIKIKKGKVDRLLRQLKCSLEDAYNYGYITLKESEYEYDKRVVFLREEDIVWTNYSIFLGYLKVNGFDCDKIKKASVENIKDLKEILEKDFQKKIIEDIKNVSEYEISSAFNIYKQLIVFLENLEEDDEIYIIQSW